MYLKIIKQIELLKTGEEAGPQITTPKSFEGFKNVVYAYCSIKL